jgi:transcriptional regulator with XRE-family HTH domain
VCFLIHKATGEEVSHTTIWKLANGQSKNPSKRLIELLARTFGVLLRRLRRGEDGAAEGAS